MHQRRVRSPEEMIGELQSGNPSNRSTMEPLVNDHRPRVSASLYSRLMASEAALPEVYTTAEPPFVITFANSAWERLCGWKKEAIGRTCAILQGELTCKRTLCEVR